MLFTKDSKMPLEPIEISIVIRTKNEERNLDNVLKKIVNQDFHGNHEIIIVDSGSQDRTAQIASGYSVRFYSINKEPFSYGYALNFGQKVAAGKIIVFLSAHCLPVNAVWLSNLVAPLIQDLRVGAVFGSQLPVKGMNPVEEFELGIFFPHNSWTPKAIFSNANCAIRKEILVRHPFNEEIAYAEDFLWRKKLPSDISVIYAPKAQVYHSHPDSLHYWALHHQRVGMATGYLQKIEGINDFYCRRGHWLAQILSRFPYLLFFLKTGYFKAFFTFPLLEAIRSFFYARGLILSRKIY